jgi:predicted enzyme related to lactoylglutathione lyase
MNPVSWFEIPVTDMDRAKKFYESVLKTKIKVEDFGNLLMGWFRADEDRNAPGATGSLVQADTYVPSHDGSMVYFGVPDINAVTARVEAAGGKVIKNKFSIGEFGFCGHFEDSEGNRIALHQGA